MFAIPSASFGCINAMLHQTFLFLGQLWQLFEVSQILEFLRYMYNTIMLPKDADHKMANSVYPDLGLHYLLKTNRSQYIEILW